MAVNNKSSSIKEAAVAGLLAGLYPMIFYYSSNFTLVNSWAHLGYFLVAYLIVPIVVFVVVYSVLKFKRWSVYVLPFLSIGSFLFLLKNALIHGHQKKAIFLILIFSVIVAYYGYQYFKKIKAFQLLLAIVGLIFLFPKLFQEMNYSEKWMKLPDNIEGVVLKNRPNIYVIQPDGYVNFSEIDKGYYGLDNKDFENNLLLKGFTNYADFRSNYPTTLTSNSAAFTMKHHYYNGDEPGEMLNSRNAIVGENAVLSVLKNNGYETHLVTDTSYLLMNRPKLFYDSSNFSYYNVSFLGTGIDEERNVVEDLKNVIEVDSSNPQFYFVEFIAPGHITNEESNKIVAKDEKRKWKDKLKIANFKTEEILSIIEKKDPDALIIIMADHGGYVGFNYTGERREKSSDRDLIYSIYSSQLSVKWSNGIPDYVSSLRSPVNLFRHVFAYLSEEDCYLDFLEANESYIMITKDSPKGVYKYINENGEIVFDKKKRNSLK